MSRCPGRHAKITSRYEGRHAKPGAPVPAAVIGTAAKVVPVSLAAGAAGSALLLSGTAFAATTTPASPVHRGATDLAPAQAAAGTWVTEGRHAAPRSVYTVAAGDTLSKVSARFCGTAADYQALAAASGISNPDLIYPGQAIKLACHAVHTVADNTGTQASGSGTSGQVPAQQPPAPAAGNVGTAGMPAFESCVISHESGGNPQAVNSASGAGGLFQFLPSTWAALGYASSYPGGAQTAPASVQEAAFEKLYAEAGTSPWAPYDGC